MDEQNLKEIDEVKSIVYPKEITSMPEIKPENKQPNNEELSDEDKDKRKRLLGHKHKKREDWEHYLSNGRDDVKIITKKEYESLSKVSLIIKSIKYFFFALFFIALIILLISFVTTFKDKEFSNTIMTEINNTPENFIDVNVTNYNTPAKVDVNVTTYLNVTNYIQIDKLIINSSYNVT